MGSIGANKGNAGTASTINVPEIGSLNVENTVNNSRFTESDVAAMNRNKKYAFRLSTNSVMDVYNNNVYVGQLKRLSPYEVVFRDASGVDYFSKSYANVSAILTQMNKNDGDIYSLGVSEERNKRR